MRGERRGSAVGLVRCPHQTIVGKRKIDGNVCKAFEVVKV